MLNPATRITRYFRRRMTTKSAANPRHMTAVSHKIMPAVFHLICDTSLLTLTTCALGVKVHKRRNQRGLAATTGANSIEIEGALDSTVPEASSR